MPKTSPEDADEIIKKMKKTRRADAGNGEGVVVSEGGSGKLRGIDRELRERERERVF